MSQAQHIRLTIDGRPVEVCGGATVLDAARRLGIAIPTLCHRDGLPPGTSCMVCVVEIEGAPRLVPSCAYPARPGLVVLTDTPAVRAARRAAVELLMGEHVGDCEAPCRRGCPAHMDIPRMLRLIAAGRDAHALAVVRRDIALPGVLGRICPAPCEKVCRRAKLDQPVSICLLKRFAADHGGQAPGDAETAPPESGRRVAIVGAGPAGLAAAFYLRRRGHACEVFDDQAAPGGALRSAVPADRLPPGVLDAEIEDIRHLGVIFHSGARVGRDITLDELRHTHEAVILAVGPTDAARAAALGVPASARGIQADSATYETPLPGVFAIGSALRPLKMAVRAGADGKECAFACDQFLKGAPAAGEARRFNSVIGKITEDELREFARQAREIPRLEPAAGAPGGFTSEEAAREAGRCLHCDCRKSGDCRLRDVVETLGADARRYAEADRAAVEIAIRPGGVVFEPGKCIKCGLCVRITEKHRDALGLTFIRRGFQMRISAPLGDTLERALGQAAAEVVAACPTGALAWEAERPAPEPG